MKALDISLILVEYIKAKKEFQLSEQEFDNANAEDVDEALTRYEKAEEHMAAIACAIVDGLIDGM